MSTSLLSSIPLQPPTSPNPSPLPRPPTPATPSIPYFADYVPPEPCSNIAAATTTWLALLQYSLKLQPCSCHPPLGTALELLPQSCSWTAPLHGAGTGLLVIATASQVRLALPLDDPCNSWPLSYYCCGLLLPCRCCCRHCCCCSTIPLCNCHHQDIVQKLLPYYLPHPRADPQLGRNHHMDQPLTTLHTTSRVGGVYGISCVQATSSLAVATMYLHPSNPVISLSWSVQVP